MALIPKELEKPETPTSTSEASANPQSLAQVVKVFSTLVVALYFNIVAHRNSINHLWYPYSGPILLDRSPCKLYC